MINNVLLATDGSNPAVRAPDFAAPLAQKFEAQVVIVHAYNLIPVWTRRAGLQPSDQDILTGTESLAENDAKQQRVLGIEDVLTEVLDVSPSDAILRVAETRNPDLIVRARGDWELEGHHLRKR